MSYAVSIHSWVSLLQLAALEELKSVKGMQLSIL